MRVLICGGRNYHNTNELLAWLLDLQKRAGRKVELLISGGYNGADRCAEVISDTKGVPCITMKAAWSFYGKGAGPKRNSWLLTYGLPDVVLAAPGNTGTADMIDQATKKGVPVIKIDPNFDWATVKLPLVNKSDFVS